jgi:hypothetical protein
MRFTTGFEIIYVKPKYLKQNQCHKYKKESDMEIYTIHKTKQKKE